MSPPPGVRAVGAIWYKTILQNTTCPKDGQGMYWEKPDGFETGTDSLNWAIVLAPGWSGMRIRAISNNVVLSNVIANSGLNLGSAGLIQPGEQRLEVLNWRGKVVMSTTCGRCVETNCPDGIYNMNYHVVGLAQGDHAGNGCFSAAGGIIGSGRASPNGTSPNWRGRGPFHYG